MDASSNGEQFRRLFEAHFDEIRGYCLRRLSIPDANDAVSEVFMTSWRRIDELPAGDGARLWLYGVARNVVRNRHRSLRRRERLSARLHSLQPSRPVGPGDAGSGGSRVGGRGRGPRRALRRRP